KPRLSGSTRRRAARRGSEPSTPRALGLSRARLPRWRSFWTTFRAVSRRRERAKPPWKPPVHGVRDGGGGGRYFTVSESTSIKLRSALPEAKGWNPFRRAFLLPLLVAIVAVLTWSALSRFEVFPSTAFPSPTDVGRGLAEKVRYGTLFDDIVASLFRV